jgi:hypothetical protein
MMAMRKRLREREPTEIELLLPWHATGTLNARDSRSVEEALARDPKLARQYAVVRREYAETIAFNESLGAPSARTVQKLFAAIDAEPVRTPRPSLNIAARLTGFFASLSPRTLAWSASVGALALLLQAGAIGVVLMNSQPGSFQTASLNNPDEPITRNITRNAGTALPQALVRFSPDARVDDILTMLDKYQAAIVEGGHGDMFRLQFANRATVADDFSGLLGRLQKEKIVSFAAAAP